MFDQNSCCKGHRKQMNTVTWHETNEYCYLACNKWILLPGKKQMNTVTWHETNEYRYLARNKWILLLGMKQMNTVTWQETNDAHNRDSRFVTVSSGSSSWHQKVTVTSSSWNAWALRSFKVQELLAQWHRVTRQITWIFISAPGRTSTLALDTHIYQVWSMTSSHWLHKLHIFISCFYFSILPLNSKDNLCWSCILVKTGCTT